MFFCFCPAFLDVLEYETMNLDTAGSWWLWGPLMVRPLLPQLASPRAQKDCGKRPLSCLKKPRSMTSHARPNEASTEGSCGSQWLATGRERLFCVILLEFLSSFKLCVYVCVEIYTHMYVCVSMCVDIYVYEYVCLCVGIYVYVCGCMCTHMYMSTGTFEGQRYQISPGSTGCCEPLNVGTGN